ALRIATRERGCLQVTWYLGRFSRAVVEAPAARPSEAVRNVLRSSFMSHSKCVFPCGTTERERNDGESRTIVSLSWINNRGEAVGQKRRGVSKGAEGEDNPGKAPRGEACLGASLEPIKTRGYEIVRKLTQ